MKDTLRQATNLVTVLLALTVNALASTLPLNGKNTGEISDLFPVYFVPAGYVFIIWAVIFLGWLVFALFQLSPAQKENPRLRRLGYVFALSNLVNAAWLFAWHYFQFGVSVLLMLTLLGLLIVSYLRLDVNRQPASRAERWAVDVPFSIYLGWISVATVANITSWLYSVDWNGWGVATELWAVIMLAVASVLGLAMALTRRDVAYVSVLAWAFAGIAVKQVTSPLVVNSAWIAAGLMLTLALYSLVRRFMASEVRAGQFKSSSSMQI